MHYIILPQQQLLHWTELNKHFTQVDVLLAKVWLGLQCITCTGQYVKDKAIAVVYKSNLKMYMGVMKLKILHWTLHCGLFLIKNVLSASKNKPIFS